MPLININPVTKAQLDSTIKTIANEVKRCTTRWKDVQGFLLNTFTDDDLVALGYDSTDITYIRSFQTALLNLVEAYNNSDKTGTADPSYIIELLADSVVF